MSEVFPLTLLPSVGWRETEDWQILAETGRGARTQLVETLVAPVWRGQGLLNLTDADTDILRRFWAARRGAAESFYFYSCLPRAIRSALACGTGNGTILAFAAPITSVFVDRYTPIAYVAGTAKTYLTEFCLGVVNRLAYSEDLSSVATWATSGGATVTRTSGQANPAGLTGPANTAWRIQTSGGSNTLKMYQVGGTPTSGFTCLTDMYVMNAGAKALTIIDGLGGVQTLPGGAATFTRVTLTSVAAGAGNSLAFYAPAAGDALDFTIWHPWCAWTNAILGTPTLSWGYLPTKTTAIAIDATGQWQVVFFTAPAAAAAVTLDAQGRQRRLARFDPTMKWDPDPYQWDRFRITISLQEAAV